MPVLAPKQLRMRPGRPARDTRNPSKSPFVTTLEEIDGGERWSPLETRGEDPAPKLSRCPPREPTR